MHMANELLSIPVASGGMALSAGILAGVSRRHARFFPSEAMTHMGVLSAFVFAGQMINVPLMGLGASGHLNGALLLAVLLGPHAAALAMSSVVIVQCLLFQDGGLLALGCNLLNIALVPSYVGFGIYTFVRKGRVEGGRANVAVMLAAVASAQLGAMSVVTQIWFSGVVPLDIGAFSASMLGVHLGVGVLEALLTIAVLRYLRRVEPDLLASTDAPLDPAGGRGVLTSFALAALILGGGISLFASNRLDGLEWSVARHSHASGQRREPSGEGSGSPATLDDIQARWVPLPGYAPRSAPLGQINPPQPGGRSAWTGFSGVVGTVTMMLLLWTLGKCVQRQRSRRIAP